MLCSFMVCVHYHHPPLFILNISSLYPFSNDSSTSWGSENHFSNFCFYDFDYVTSHMNRAIFICDCLISIIQMFYSSSIVQPILIVLWISYYRFLSTYFLIDTGSLPQFCYCKQHCQYWLTVISLRLCFHLYI